MNKTKCVHCGKELEYEGFYCPTYCKKCESKIVWSTAGKVIARESDSIKDVAKAKIYVSCIICGEQIALNENEEHYLICGGGAIFKVCDKCKQAVMKMRGDK